MEKTKPRARWASAGLVDLASGRGSRAGLEASLGRLGGEEEVEHPAGHDREDHDQEAHEPRMIVRAEEPELDPDSEVVQSVHQLILSTRSG